MRARKRALENPLAGIRRRAKRARYTMPVVESVTEELALPEPSVLLGIPEHPRDVAQSYVSVSDYMALDGSEEMRALLLASGLMDEVTQPPAPPLAENTVHYSQRALDFLALEPRTALWPQQREAVDFMAVRENSPPHGCCGGLICDRMGDGKTFQMLYHIFAELQRRCRETGRPYGAPTLIVVPKSLVTSWCNEIERHFPRGAFALLQLTPEARLELIEREMGRRSRADYLTHNFTLVITTYPVVVSAYKRCFEGSVRTSAQFADLLYDVDWERIVADEAHVFADRTKKKFLSMCRLRARFRWTLTGTPVLNEASDICSAFHFLQVHPDLIPEELASRTERVSGTVAAARAALITRSRLDIEDVMRVRDILSYLMLRRQNTVRDFDARTVLIDFETEAETTLYNHYYELFRRECVANGRPLEERKRDRDYQRNYTGVRILRLRQLCASPAILSSLEMPPGLLLDSGFALEDREHYNTTDSILRMRPVPTLAYLAAARLVTNIPPILGPLFGSETAPVPAAFTPLSLRRMLYDPADSAAYRRLEEIFVDLDRRLVPTFGTKVRMFVRYYQTQVAADEKYLIFSSWVTALEVLQHAFACANIQTTTLKGEHKPAERDAIIRDFEQSRTCRAMLVSLHVGSMGLNLPCANHTTVVDRWWNPHTESQAISRMMRPGQTRSCHVYNIVVRNSVEEDVCRMAAEKEKISFALLEKDLDRERVTRLLANTAPTMLPVVGDSTSRLVHDPTLIGALAANKNR